MVARGKVGQAFIEAVAETAGFERDLEGSLKRAVDHASRQRNFDPMVSAAALAGDHGGDEFGDHLARQMQRRLDNNRGGILRGLIDVFFRIGASAADVFSQGFSSALRGGPVAGNAAIGASGLLAGVVEASVVALPSLLITIGILIPLVPLLTSVIFALGGALFSLVGILGAVPGIAFAAIAGLAPLLLIFEGIGGAVSALVSGDMQKFNEELKKLSPSAGRVLRELQGVLPFFRQLRRDVQESFFSQVIGALTRFVKGAGPALSGGLQNVAFALGKFVDQLATFAASPQVANFLAHLFDFTARGIGKATPIIIHFLESIIRIADASLPAIERFFAKIGGGIDTFASFLERSVANGDFEQFLDSAFTTLGDLVEVTGQLLGLLKDMFSTTDESGQTFLEDVAEAIRQLREFFQSPEGKQFIENMITLAHDFGVIMIWVAQQIANVIALFAAAIETFNKAGEALDRFIEKKKRFSGNPAAGLVGTIFGVLGIPGFASGGITSGPSIAGEAGPEAILPLDDPVRARQIASDPRVADALGGGDTTVIAVFDGEPFQARIVRTIRGDKAKTARALAQKPRR